MERKTQKGWEVITYDPPKLWHYFSMQELNPKKKVAPQEKYNKKGEVIEKLYIEMDNYKDKQKIFLMITQGISVK